MQLARVFGIRIGADYSWFLILFLAIFFAREQFALLTDASESAVFVAAVAEAFLFFGSIIAHEMGHALAARREGIEVAGIDLFLFGGLMHMKSEPVTPGAEFRVAAAGPVVTLLIVLATGGAAFALGGAEAIVLQGDALPLGATVVSFVAGINLLVLIFNLLPAYPLDGGRIARAAVWKATGDRHRATRAAAVVGRGFGMVLILAGVLLIANGQAFDGIYTAFLGWILGSQARNVAVQSAFTERLEGVTVADLMDRDPVAIPADTATVRAYEDYFLRYGYDWFPVVDDDGGYVGRVERAQASAEGTGPVRGLAGTAAAVGEGASLEDLLRSEPLRAHGAVAVVDAHGRLRGVVTTEHVARALRTKLVAG